MDSNYLELVHFVEELLNWKNSELFSEGTFKLSVDNKCKIKITVKGKP